MLYSKKAAMINSAIEKLAASDGAYSIADVPTRKERAMIPHEVASVIDMQHPYLKYLPYAASAAGMVLGRKLYKPNPSVGMIGGMAAGNMIGSGIHAETEGRLSRPYLKAYSAKIDKKYKLASMTKDREDGLKDGYRGSTPCPDRKDTNKVYIAAYKEGKRTRTKQAAGIPKYFTSTSPKSFLNSWAGKTNLPGVPAAKPLFPKVRPPKKFKLGSLIAPGTEYIIDNPLNWIGGLKGNAPSDIRTSLEYKHPYLARVPLLTGAIGGLISLKTRKLMPIGLGIAGGAIAKEVAMDRAMKPYKGQYIKKVKSDYGIK